MASDNNITSRKMIIFSHHQINKNINRVSKQLSLCDFRLRLIYRGLPTNLRRFETNQITKCGPRPLGGAGMGDIRHIYFECKTTALATKMVTFIATLLCSSRWFESRLPPTSEGGE